MKTQNRSRLVKRLNRILIYLLVLLAVFLSIAPIIYLLITSFKEPELTFAIPPVWNFTPTWLNYDVVLSSSNFGKYFLNSLCDRPFGHARCPTFGYARRLWVLQISLPRAFLAAYQHPYPTDVASHHASCAILCTVQRPGLDRHPTGSDHFLFDIYHPVKYLDDDRFF